MPRRGYGSPEVEHAYLRAQELCEAAGNLPQLFQALFGVSGLSFHKRKVRTTFALGERLSHWRKTWAIGRLY